MLISLRYSLAALASATVLISSSALAERCNPPYKTCGESPLTYECPPCPPGGPHLVTDMDWSPQEKAEKDRAFKDMRMDDLGAEMRIVFEKIEPDGNPK